MDGNHFVDFAKSLADSDASAPACRTAASRAYYGAYHVALAFLNRQGFYPVGANPHEWVQRHFLNCTSEAATEIGSKLKNLHVSRKESDYHLDKVFAEKPAHAKSTAMRAQQVISDIEACVSTCPTIIDEMKAYRKKLGMP